MDMDSRKVSKLAIEQFRVENRVKVCMMRWLRKLRPSGQYASIVVKVVIKEDVEKLLKMDSISFNRGTIVMSPFKERHTPVAYFKCKRFRHRARDCI